MLYQSSTQFIDVGLESNCLTIAFNRPEALNALRPEMLSEAAQLIEKTKSDQNVMVVVLRGAGKVFSAGVDLKVLQDIQPDGGIIGNVFDEPAAKLATAIRDSDVPVIARAVGACFTGALEIALHCDFVYTTNATKFGDTHTKFGLRPTWGMSQTLSRAVGQRRATQCAEHLAQYGAPGLRAGAVPRPSAGERRARYGDGHGPACRPRGALDRQRAAPGNGGASPRGTVRAGLLPHAVQLGEPGAAPRGGGH